MNGKCARGRKGGIEIGRACRESESGAKCEKVKRGRTERRRRKTTPWVVAAAAAE